MKVAGHEAERQHAHWQSLDDQRQQADKSRIVVLFAGRAVKKSRMSPFFFPLNGQ
jgi:hypothetical protein